MADVKIGNGFDEGVTCGPLINKKAVADVDELVQGAIATGATVALGGSPFNGNGCFYIPTVLRDVAARRRDRQAGDLRPGGADHHLHRSRRGDPPGQRHRARAHRLRLHARSGEGAAVSEQIQAGMIGLNRGAVSDPAAPFGGMKQSGLGREGSTEGIYEFCETQYIATNW